MPEEYIKDGTVQAIFEAGIQHEDTEVFVDILERDGAAWNLIEVKSSSSVKDEYIDDVTVQYMVLTRAGTAKKVTEGLLFNQLPRLVKI